MRGLIGLTIGPLLGAVLASVPLSAQERPAELSGCYDIAADSLEVGSGSGYESELPPRIEFTGPYRGFGEPDTSRTQIVVPEGALPSVHSLTWGQIVGDSLNLVFSTGFGGVKAMLGWAGDRWVGGARTFRDFGPPFEFDAGSIELVPANCDTPPPVSVDAMLPVARSVELEGRLVITLGEPLPAALGTTPKRFANKSVTGRTTGLFAGTDSNRGGSSGAVGRHSSPAVLQRPRCIFDAGNPFQKRLWRP